MPESGRESSVQTSPGQHSTETTHNTQLGAPCSPVSEGLKTGDGTGAMARGEDTVLHLACVTTPDELFLPNW